MQEDEYEFLVNIDNHAYGMDTLTSVHIQQPLFDKFDVGLACCASATIAYRNDLAIEPSRGAKVIASYRKKKSSNIWAPIGTYFIDQRSLRAEVRTLICYDSMMKADVPFLDPDSTEFVGEWPRSMTTLVTEIASRMDVTLDSRTVINPNYTLEYPNEDTMRTMLQYIAAAHAGNWIITNKNQLLLVPLFSSMPPETHYLITEYGSPIVFGEDRILV